MSLTIILSGPKASENQARTTLASIGLDVQAQAHDHGLPAVNTGDTQEPQAFITVTGDDINLAHDAVTPLGWTLRMHYETPEPAPASAEQQLAERLARLERELAELKAGTSG